MGKNRSSAGRQGVNPTSSLTQEQWESAKTAEQLAELTGWTFSKTSRGSFKFYDSENDMMLFIDKTMLSNHFINQNSDDAQNVNKKYAGAVAQNLRDIVRMVYELPSENKRATPTILFRNQFATTNLGQHGVAYNRFDGEATGDHIVIINSASFKNIPGHSIRRTLLHETYHSADFMMGKATNYYDSDTYGISVKDSFRSAVKTDAANVGVKGVSMNSGGYGVGSSTYYKECWADAASVVKLKQMGYSNESIKLYNGRTVTVDQWIDTYPNVYEVTANEINSISSGNFGKSAMFESTQPYYVKQFKLDK